MHRLCALKQAMFTVANNMMESNGGQAFLDHLGAPPTAATAFSIIADIRSGILSSPRSIRRRLPNEWLASVAPPNASATDILQSLKDVAV
eukprot:2416263-Pyramimonas_sp.AAC.1